MPFVKCWWFNMLALTCLLFYITCSVADTGYAWLAAWRDRCPLWISPHQGFSWPPTVDNGQLYTSSQGGHLPGLEFRLQVDASPGNLLTPLMNFTPGSMCLYEQDGRGSFWYYLPTCSDSRMAGGMARFDLLFIPSITVHDAARKPETVINISLALYSPSSVHRDIRTTALRDYYEGPHLNQSRGWRK